MSLPEYKKSYAVLGVFQDDNWDTIRNAYKRLIRKWHPDRFQESDQREFAENKCKEINLSFRLLDDFYQQHGHLPQVEHSGPDGMAAASVRGPAADTEVVMNDTAPSEMGSAWNKSDITHVYKRRSFRPAVALVAAIVAGFWVTESLLTGHLETGSTVTSDGFQPPASNAANGSETSENFSGPAGTAHPKQLLGEWGEDAMTSLSNGHPAQPNTRLPYIDIGSTKQEVLELQGRPARETEYSWEYGLSRINFRHDRVSDWYENPMNPLRVRK